MQSACAVLYCHLWPVRLYHIFPHYLINVVIFEGKNLLNMKCVFWSCWTWNVCFIWLNMKCVFWSCWTWNVCFIWLNMKCVFWFCWTWNVFWFCWTWNVCFDFVEHEMCVLILLNMKCVFWFPLQHLSLEEELNEIINVRTPSSKAPVILVTC
jgi:hypothetical protein